MGTMRSQNLSASKLATNLSPVIHLPFLCALQTKHAYLRLPPLLALDTEAGHDDVEDKP